MNGATLDQHSQRLDRLEAVVWFLAAGLLAAILLLLVTAARAFRQSVVLRDKKRVARLSIGRTSARRLLG